MMSEQGKTLRQAIRLSPGKILNPGSLRRWGSFGGERPVLVLLAAGKGTRFGQAPKCAQLVCGVPVARHSIEAFKAFAAAPVICIVGYRHEEVMGALGDDCIYVLSDDPTGGTAYAAFEAFCVEALDADNPVLAISMGDRVVTPSVFRMLYETHTAGAREADLTFLTAVYEPPKNRGKGRIVRISGLVISGSAASSCGSTFRTTRRSRRGSLAR